MSNALNTYLLILKNSTTKQVWPISVKNISENNTYYEFDFTMPDDCPAGEYNYYLVWDIFTPDEVELDIKNDILDSTFKIKKSHQIITLRDVMPETGILKYIKDNDNEMLEYEQKNDFLVYEQ